MDFNISDCYKIFETHFNNISKQLDVKCAPDTQLGNYIAVRAIVLLKLDLMLIEHRSVNDPERLVLFGRNALYHYLLQKHCVPINVAKNMSLIEILVVLTNDIRGFELQPEIRNLIAQDYNLKNVNYSRLNDNFKKFDLSEWDADFADKRLS